LKIQKTEDEVQEVQVQNRIKKSREETLKKQKEEQN